MICGSPSGVGTQSRQLVLHTAHKFIWRQLAASINHPEKGKVISISDSINKEMNIDNADVLLYPIDGYGDFRIVREMLKIEKPDAIICFTDPRYWIFLFFMENEIRDKIPIMYWHLWDGATPYPKYNKTYYQSCDALFAISKQSFNMSKHVLGNNMVDILDFNNIDNAVREKSHKQLLAYVPHGINENEFYKPRNEIELQEIKELRKLVFGEQDADKIEFVVLYNSRNIHRKVPGNVIFAYRDFFRTLTSEQQEKTRLLMHTQSCDNNGTDLAAIVQDCAPDIKIIFSPNPITPKQLNQLYAIADVVINCSNQEGFGLGICESLFTEKIIAASVHGGLQDMMGFRNNEGNYLDANEDFTEEWGTNADGKYKNHGEWAFPVFPADYSCIGSPPTPYLMEYHSRYQDFAKALREIYDLPKEERERRGKLAREFAIENNFNSKSLAKNMSLAIDIALERFIPREPFALIKI